MASVEAQPLTAYAAPGAAALQANLNPVQAILIPGSSGFLIEGVVALDLVPSVDSTSLYLQDLVVPLGFSLIGGNTGIGDLPSSSSDGEYARTGHRRALPLLVTRIGVAEDADLDFPDSATHHFLVAAAFAETTGDLYDAGAFPGAIGTRWADDVLTFRATRRNEVVWWSDPDDGDKGFYRFNGQVWQAYKTPPERAADDMRVFDLLDPHKVGRLYVRLLGGLYAEAFNELGDIVDLIDPSKAPADYLAPLAIDLAVPFEPGETTETRRARLSQAIRRHRQHGRRSAVIARLADLGYTGDVLELWIDAAGAVQGIWTALSDASGSEQTDAVNRGIAGLIEANTGNKNDLYLTLLHGTATAVPHSTDYYPSSGVAVVVNNRDGTALSTSVSPGYYADLKERVAAAASEVLPVHAFVRLVLTKTGVNTYAELP